MNNICSYCKRPETGFKWCQYCNSKKFQRGFDEWTSGNKHIDKFIQEVQLNARNYNEVIEWIPYNGLRNIIYLTKGGFSTVYKAIWLDGFIEYWDSENQKWSRNFSYLNYINKNDHEITKEKDIKLPLNKNEVKGFHVVLKSLNNSLAINDNFLNEWKYYLQFMNSARTSVVNIHGITQDPETLDYMIVMDLVKEGNLRFNLLMKKYNPFEKYENLRDIAKQLKTLHDCNLVHGDFHSGNILLEIVYSYICDFGLSRPVNQTINSNEIYGVIPYMAPEVLRGKPYTKAADVYSFGIIMWEFTSGIPAFNDRSHDFDLSLDICRELRPKIVKGTLPVYERLMKRCWDFDPNKRPTSEELYEIFSFWFTYCPKSELYDRIPIIPSNVPVIENHPLSCYTSRKIDYSAKINEILGEEELSCKFVIDKEKEFNNETSFLLSESLENCLISD